MTFAPAASDLEHFREHGWLRLHGAFTAQEAAAMRAVVWEGLAGQGVREDPPSTWTVERPGKLQGLKSHPAFEAVGSRRLMEAVGAILGTSDFERPKTWGAVFVAFPSEGEWEVPAGGWHIDANYRSQLEPPKGVQIHALFGEVAPRCGATLILSGSHRLVHRWFQENPPPPEARSAELRRSLQRHPYIRDLHADGDREARTQRIMGQAEVVEGIPLQVIENAGAAGDVLLLHPLTLHVAALNPEPRRASCSAER